MLSRARHWLRAAYLRMLIKSAEFDANAIQAESLTAPVRLARVRAYITDLTLELQHLEARRVR
jgi:hypothetical protein